MPVLCRKTIILTQPQDPSQLSLALMQRADNENTPPADCLDVASVSDLPNSPTGTNYSPTIALTPKNARRATNPYKHLIPHLNFSNTAPRSTATEQQPHAQIRMARSFGGFADRPGDTQADSQIYKHYTSTVISHLRGDNGTSDGLGLDGASEGPRGHVDIVNRWEQDVLDDPTSPTSFNDDDVDELSPDTQFPVQTTAPVKFMLPETPAMAGRKRNSRGEMLSSATTKTPGSGLTTFFANGAGTGGPSMSLTQLFNATQSATSPLPDAPRSDPIFQRPSPNFVRHSSPPAVTSSPTKLLRSDPSRATTEPRDTYMTMKESQELREHQMQAEADLERLRAKDDDDWDDEPTVAEEILARRRLKARIDEEALRSYASLTAPRRDLLVNSRAKPMVISSDSAYITPARSSRTRRVIDISDDIPEEDLSEDGSTDELGDLPPSTGKSRRLSAVQANGIQVPMTSSRPEKTSSGNQTQSSPSPESLIRRRRPYGSKLGQVTTSMSQLENFSQSRSKALGGTQNVAVADSQSEKGTDPDSFPLPPRLVEPSSLESNPHISQSQLSNRSQRPVPRSALDTSSIPRPPIDSSPVIREHSPERMPSSPPIVFDEHSGGEEDREVDVGANTDGDMELVASDDIKNAEDYENALGAEEYAPIHSSPTHAGDQVVREEPTGELSRKRVHSTVPESDAARDRESSIPETSHMNKSEAIKIHASTTTSHTGIVQADTNSTEVYQTARSQISLSPQKRLLSQNPPSTRESLGFPQLRRLTDIAAEPESQQSIGEVDIDVGLITEDFDKLNKILSGSSPLQPTRKRNKVYSAKALRSPAKQANQLPTATPPSARKREGEGAFAAAQARETAIFSKPAVLKKGRLSRPTHKIQGKSSPSIKRVIPNASHRPLEIAETPQSKPSEVWSKERPPTHPPAPVEDSIEISVEQAHVHVPQADIPNKAPQSDAALKGETSMLKKPMGDFLTPSRVLAHFRGRNIAYYPATCLGLVEGSNFRIRFDDGTIDQLEPHNVRRLDLEVGDLVKVDLPKMRVKTYVVAGFKDKVVPGEDEYPCTDQHGYRTAVLGVKPRDSLPKSDVKTRAETVDVPITSIYVTSIMWPRFKDRIYTHSPGPAIQNKPRLQTPSINASIPGTPKSRSRRESAINMGISMHRTTSVTSIARSSGLFTNMAFAVSFTNQDSERDSISALILTQGGLILEPGFETLFQLSESPALNNHPSPSKSPKKPRASKDEPFALTPEAAGLGFVALIADTHSRRAKYMQALALNIPCLASRWVRDCIAQGAVLPFQRYLLPAGASAFLGGVVRSRTMAVYDPAGPDARFADVLARRELLLGGQNVLLVMGKGKGREERKRPYLFLTHALGARRVCKCRDLETAREMLERKVWDWVYVDGEIRGEAEGALFNGHSGKEKGRKRKRESSEEGVVSQGIVNGKRVKVAGDEFVVQSLILGALAED
ncbi:hypothetical protein V2W45_1387116 [Cenococcum geophilum]